MLSIFRPALVMLGALTILTGLAYPLAVTGIAQAVMEDRADGSLLLRDGTLIGSALIGQAFEGPGYLHPRPSAVGYDAAAAGASNLGPTSAALVAEVTARAEAFRSATGADSVPADAVTASGSGLDPHVSPATAMAQAARISEARGMPVKEVRALIEAEASGPWLGLFGAPHVNVLEVNLALDGAR